MPANFDLVTIGLSALGGAILKPVAQYVVGYVAFLFGPINVRKLSGNWRTNWGYKDDDKTNDYNNLVELKQFGPYISGQGTGGRHNYKIKGKYGADGFIHGTWEDIQDSTDWYGSFKIQVSTDGSRMQGKWLGKDDSCVRAGDWKWLK